MTGIVIIATLEAIIAFALLPWLPPKLHGMEVLIAAGVYIVVFLSAVAILDHWSKKRSKRRDRALGSLEVQRANKRRE